jgi:TonB-dependent starch-binding outer membrane protein SusC
MPTKFSKSVCLSIIGILFSSLSLLAQNTITGKTMDVEGNPISDVNIQVKGKKTISSSDRNGIYKIIAANEDLLVFTSVGFNTVQVRASEALSVKLTVKTAALSDVVVVGYGEKKRKNVTSSIGSIKGDDLRKSPVASFDQALAGRIAGVQVTANTGDPGGNVSIRIRGNSTVSSVSSNDPLYVIDDLVLPQGANLSSISPSDIESIDVLKDAAASAIYGIRAANGVVVVKTKKGTKDKNRVSIDMYTGVTQTWKRLNVLNIKEHAELNNEILGNWNAENAGNASFIPIGLNPEWSTPQRIANLPRQGTNWQDEIFRNGVFRDVNLSFSGGSGKTTYYFSLGNRDEKGIIINSSFKRTNIRANLDNQVKDWLRMGTNLTYSDTRRTVTGGTNDDRTGFMQAVLMTSPAIPVFASDGAYGQAPSRQVLWYGNLYNPRNIIDATNPKYGSADLYGSAYANIKFPKGFSFNSTIGVGQFSGTYSIFNANLITLTGAVSPFGQLFAGRFSGLSWNWDNYINWNKWIKGHAIEATVGHIAQAISNEGIAFNQQGFVNQQGPYQLPGLGDPAQISFPPTYPREFAYESYFGRVNYNYKERYYIGGAYRIDKASPAFATNNKVAYFPSISTKWRITKEKFFEEIKFFNDLSFRGSWGISGNIGGEAYPGYSLLKVNSNYPFYTSNSNNSISGVSLGQFPNTESTWEKIYQSDIGMDASMLNGKLNLTIDWYSRNTRNMLLPLKLRSIFGGSAAPPIVNVPGQGVVNKGIEIALGYKGKVNKKFSYEINGNISFNKNKVVDIGNNPFIELSKDLGISGYETNRTAVGQPIGSFFGWVFDGIYQNQAEVNKGPIDLLAAGGSKPGDIRYKDLTNDGKIDENDRTYIGQPTPTFIYGLNFGASYENFDFSMLIQGIGGNKVFNFIYQQATLGDPKYSEGINRLSDVKDRWVNDGQPHNFPRVSFDDKNKSFNTRISDFWLQNGAFTRIKNIQLGYTISEKLIKKIGIEKFRVYISASNLFTFTKYKGFDPEVGQNATGYADIYGGTNKDLQSGVDRGVFPQPRMLLFGINVTF